MNDAVIILGLDQARAGGWAVHDGRRVRHWGVAKNAGDRRAALLVARDVTISSNGRLLVVYEDHTQIPARAGYGTPALVGMGDARGRWFEQLEMSGHPRAWIMGVTMGDWRRRTIGNAGGTERIKKRAIEFASRLVREKVIDDNAAEAIIIAHWGALDGLARYFAKRELRRVKERATSARTARA